MWIRDSNWVIDPMDGTTNFMRGYRHSAVSIGLVQDGEGVLGVVYNPYTEELFAAVRGEGAFLNGAPIQVSQAAMKLSLIHIWAVSRKVYLPEGARWVSLHNGDSYSGGQTVEVNAPLESIPVCLRDGAHSEWIGKI